jgi:hypothetical protein
MIDGLLVGAWCSGLKLGTAAEACDGNGNCARVGEARVEVYREDGVDANRSDELCLLPRPSNEAGRLPLAAAAAGCLAPFPGEPASDDDASPAGESLGDNKALISISSHQGPSKAHSLAI